MSAYEHAAREEAARFREEHGLGLAPIADLVALIEQTRGVDVTVLEVVDNDEHGLTMLDPDRGVAIVAVACSVNPMRWRSTLAHELGHLVFGDHQEGKPGTLSAQSMVEKRAQSFARHLLIPAEALTRLVGSREIDLQAFSDLVQRFEVSPMVAAIQLREVGLVSRADADRLGALTAPTLASRYGWADQYRALQGESNQRRAPQRLLRRAIDGYVNGVVSLETVASVRGASVSDLEREFAEAGIVPEQRPRLREEDHLSAGHRADVDLSWLDEDE